MATLINTLWEGARYRGGIGHWAYQFHRLAGLATLLFLAIHILDTATVYFFPSLYQHAIELYRSTPFMLGEIALVAGVLFHGLNGLKIIIFDFWPQLWTHDREVKTTWAVMIGTFILWLPAAIWMGNSLIQCNFLNACGG
jgi:succinate dehydrogenase / fumarate reductase cytochrome b subunit